MTRSPEPLIQADLLSDPSDLSSAGERLTQLALLRFYEVSGPGPASPSISLPEKIRNEAAIRIILQDLEKTLSPWQGHDQLNETDMAELETLIQKHLLLLDEGRYLFDEPFLAFFIDQGYLDCAKAFLLQARAMDGGLTFAEIFQALRNVWIMNSLQLMWDIPVAITQAVYAYSMLYPYTDNYLDDPAVSRADKMMFNELIRQALQGGLPMSHHPASRRVLELIGLIRDQYDPLRYPQVIESIRQIQKAQTSSLRQDQEVPMEQTELLHLSFFKGGASVLADAFLVKGALSPPEMEFAFLYGSFLQLVDDLQDARDDLAHGHQTLFSGQIQLERLDGSIRQLMDFIHRINEPAQADAPMVLYMKKVIGACSQLMILDVLGKAPALISPTYFEELERPCKVRLTFFGEMAMKMESLASTFQGQGNFPDL